MIKTVCSLLLLFITIISTSSAANHPVNSIVSDPQPLPSLTIINNTQQTAEAGGCSFTVRISTSCSSTRFTRDQIGLIFGDAYGNQVYEPRLDDPSTYTFESCSEDTFEINGPCTYQVCYLYVRRSGYDGWKPHSVEISGYNTRPVSFDYDVFVPADTWYGFDYCNNSSPSSFKQLRFMLSFLIFFCYLVVLF